MAEFGAELSSLTICRTRLDSLIVANFPALFGEFPREALFAAVAL
jgi:hypothetical protein